MKKYKDEQWLMTMYIDKNLTRDKVAEMSGVTGNTIRRYLRKYNIKKEESKIYASRKTTEIPIKYVIDSCSQCGNNAKIKRPYYIKRIRKGFDSFYCSRKCANKSHSKHMTGEGNPNYDGKWHAECPSEWSREKRTQATTRMVETVLREGTFRGENNGRWAGGRKSHNCVICGDTATFPPHIHRSIERGERSPCCSNACASALGRRNVKYEATSIEIKMEEELSLRGIEYVAQYNLNDKFSLDFFLPEYSIVIECDGDYWHNLPEVKTRDKSKNAYILACGYSLYRFWEHEINESVESCVDIILAEINEQEAIL